MVTKEDVIKGIKTLAGINTHLHNGDTINKSWLTSIRNIQWILDQLIELDGFFENAQKQKECNRKGDLDGWD